YVKDPSAARLKLPPLPVVPLAATTEGAAGPSTSVGADLASAESGSAMEATPGRVAPATWSCVLPAVAYEMGSRVSTGGSFTGTTCTEPAAVLLPARPSLAAKLRLRVAGLGFWDPLW